MNEVSIIKVINRVEAFGVHSFGPFTGKLVQHCNTNWKVCERHIANFLSTSFFFFPSFAMYKYVSERVCVYIVSTHMRPTTREHANFYLPKLLLFTFDQISFWDLNFLISFLLRMYLVWIGFSKRRHLHLSFVTMACFI